MNIVLWVLQVLLALLCISGGAFQILKYEDLQKQAVAIRKTPRGLWAVLGALNCAAGVGLLVPSLAAWAGLLAAAESLAISALYVYHGDRSPLSFSAAMTVLGAFIAYGRFALKPF